MSNIHQCADNTNKYFWRQDSFEQLRLKSKTVTKFNRTKESIANRQILNCLIHFN